MHLTIYSKPDCHLCDEAKSVLRSVGEEFSVPLQEINIEQDAEAFAKYHNEIPVVFVDDVKLFKGKVDEAKLRKALATRL